MRWYTAIGMKKDDADGRFCVWVDGEEKVLTEMETILWAALTWSFLLGIIGFIRTYLIFRTADKKTYEIVEGLVTGIDGKNPFARLRKIRVSDPAGRQSELLLDKNVKVLEGKRYRFYFGINEKKLVGIRRVDAALNNGTFLGNEEI